MRGDIVIAATPGDYGKPRPHVVVQSDSLQVVESVVLCPITSERRQVAFRLHIDPDETNGLKVASEIMADKIITVRRDRISRTIGRLDVDGMSQLEARIALVLGLIR